MIKVYMFDLTIKRPSRDWEGLFKAAANIGFKEEWANQTLMSR
jgi:hypothetical protein